MNKETQELLISLSETLRDLVAQARAYDRILPPTNTEGRAAISSLQEMGERALEEVSDIKNILRAPLSDTPLSSREREVLNLVAKGMSNKEIAYSLKISDRTVQFHLKSIFTKTQTSSRTEAVTSSIKMGWIKI